MARISAVPDFLSTRHEAFEGELAVERIAVVTRHPIPAHPLREKTAAHEASASANSPDTAEPMAAPEAAIRLQLNRMLGSRVFAQSERLGRFLRFIVDHALAGNQSWLKEYVIGSEVYDRKPPYHPSQDSIVRTEARRLRTKLKEYYELEGKDDPVYIYLRPGSYVPVFQHREPPLCGQTASPAGHPSPLVKNAAISIAILPFSDISRSPLSARFSRAIPDELAYTLMRIEGCRVISLASTAHHIAQERDVVEVMSKAGAQIAFEGSVREEGNHIRVTACIVDASGFRLWARRFDTEANSRTLFAIEEQIASALSVGCAALCRDFQCRAQIC